MLDDRQRALSRERAFLLEAALAGDFHDAATRLGVAVKDFSAPTAEEVHAAAHTLAALALPIGERRPFADEVVTEFRKRKSSQPALAKPSVSGLGHIFANAATTTPAQDTSYKSIIMVKCSRCGAPQQEVCVFECRFCQGPVS